MENARTRGGSPTRQLHTSGPLYRTMYQQRDSSRCWLEVWYSIFSNLFIVSMCNDWALLSARFVTMVCAIHVRCVESVLRATPYRRVRDTTMSQSKALLIHEWIPPADARREMLHRRPARSLTDFRGTSSNEVYAQALTSSVPVPSAHVARAWTCPRLQIDRKLTHTCMATDTPRRTHA